MTASLEVTSGCAGQTGWTGTTTLSLGTIQNENDKLNSGFERISQSLGKADASKGMNFLGQTRDITIRGRYKGADLSGARAFTRNLKLICDYQLEQGTTTTLVYTNTNSIIYDFSQGVTGMMKDYTITASYSDNRVTVNYTIILQECVNL